MTNQRLLAPIFGLVVLIGLALAVTSSDSKRAADEATYAGQQTCMTSGCHKSTSVFPGHEEFQKTMHANIHNRPNPENVIIDDWFERDTVLKAYTGDIHEAPRDTFYVQLSKLGTIDEYWIRMYTQGEHADTTEYFRVAYNYGGNGWMQRFLLEVNGNYYPAPFQYILGSYADTVTSDGRTIFIDIARWAEVDKDLDAWVFFDRHTERFYKESWDKRCASCHVNGFDVSRDTVEGGEKWFAHWVGSDGADSAVKDINIAIGCESCHGPGSKHVADPENKEFQKEISPGRWDPTESSRFWTDRKLDLCNQCHNRISSTQKLHTYAYDDENMRPYAPGNELNDYINDSVKDATYWADGKTSYAHHQAGQDYWRSAHYTDHVFKDGCFSCHSPHNQTDYPYQLDRNWYSMEKGEGCVSCHPSMAETEFRDDDLEYNTHTQHLKQNSQCVNCHYTKTATITFADFFEFSDHSDQVIRPTATIAYRNDIRNGMPNTCASSCHRNGFGERNRPDAFDRNASLRYSMGDSVAPMEAPDYGIHDIQWLNWKDPSDLALADSLWEGYKRLYPQYVSAVSDETGGNAVANTISSVSPNPATTDVTTRFRIARKGHITLTVFDVNGNSVRYVVDMDHEAGAYTATWQLNDERGSRVAPGVYFIRLAGPGFNSVKSVVVQ